MFVALGGLYQGMNGTLEACGQSKRFNTKLVIVPCFIWLAYNLLVFLCIIVCSVAMAVSPYEFDASSSFGGSIFYFLWYLFTLAIYWIIDRNVREFIDIKASLEG